MEQENLRHGMSTGMGGYLSPFSEYPSNRSVW
jgi:hypothetical protein